MLSFTAGNLDGKRLHYRIPAVNIRPEHFLRAAQVCADYHAKRRHPELSRPELYSCYLTPHRHIQRIFGK
ncbi:hypothetical protein Metlim_2324 [Methanoplanus limicola DSM 2279]|uniref:Uncharacterized protein n=1 Tax=Methanoplanus limicola DSM 2279 TaxID=937775 RepID=H1Z233_9EURY|nr:hypothetical protein Metlim_2324 [Methanoplanus limicola DSM 2279]